MDPKYHYRRTIIGPPTKRLLNGVSLVCRWWPNIERADFLALVVKLSLSKWYPGSGMMLDCIDS